MPGLPEGIRPGAGRIGRQIADEMIELTRYHKTPYTKKHDNLIV